MKARVKTRVTIHADAKTVFRYLSDTTYHRVWNSRLQTVSPEAQLKEGAKYMTQSTVLGVRIKALNQVTSFVQDKQLEIQNRTGMVQYVVCYTLQPHPKGTIVESRTVASADSKAFFFAKPMLEQLARRELNTDLRALKHLVEQKSD
jgi:hypothetical protein